MRHFLLKLIVIGMWLPAGCSQDAALPEATSGVSSDAKPSPSPSATPTPIKDQYYGWGANTGTPAVKQRLAICNAAGTFFDRVAKNGQGECKSAEKIVGNCSSLENIKLATQLSETQVTQLQAAMNDKLAGYLPDQCKDEPTRYLIYFVLPAKDKGPQLVTSISVTKETQ